MEFGTGIVSRRQLPFPLRSSKPRHFVFIHGSGHGAWCWYKVRELLERCGLRVTCIDLAGAGISRTDPNSVLSFHDYNKPLEVFMSQLPEDEKVILVGHSAGGLSVTHSILMFESKIEVAVYVAGVMNKTGFATKEDIKDGVPDISMYPAAVRLGHGLGPNAPPTSGYLVPEYQRKLIYNLSPDCDATLGSMLVRPWPAIGIMDAKFDWKREPNIRRVYMKTAKDQLLAEHQQESMIQRWPPEKVISLDADHSAFFSAAKELALELVKLVFKYDATFSKLMEIEKK